jgi:DNA-binding response OmpR family regulator
MVRILIVDDDRALAELLGWALRDEGYEVAVAFNPVDGIDIGLADPPDVILTDWMLRHSLHGGNVSQSIREVCPWTKTIVMTGHPEIVSGTWGWRDYVDLIVEKPFHLRHLIESIQSVCRQIGYASESFSYQ